MPLVFDGPAQQFVPIQASGGQVNQARWSVYVKFFNGQQSDIRIRAFVFVFRNLSGTSLGEFFCGIQARQNNDRAFYVCNWPSQPTDIISVIPLYDFTRVQIWSEGIGLTP